MKLRKFIRIKKKVLSLEFNRLVEGREYQVRIANSLFFQNALVTNNLLGEQENEDISAGLYGSYGLVQSKEKKMINFIDVDQLTPSLAENEVFFTINLPFI